jgi:YVTN family beta-propeller protein
MTNSTRKFSKLVLGTTIRIVAIALLLVGFGASAIFAQPRAYVANNFDKTLSVIDSATNTAVATVRVEGAGAVAVTPDGAFAYLATPNDTVSVIDTATNTVVATVPIGPGPLTIAITPNGAFACMSNGHGSNNTVSNAVKASLGCSRPQGNAGQVRLKPPRSACAPTVASSAGDLCLTPTQRCLQLPNFGARDSKLGSA